MDKIKDAFFGNKKRVLTGIGMILSVAILLAIDNFYLMWAILGSIYILAIYETNKLIKIEEEQTVIFGLAIASWIATLFVNKIALISVIPAMLMASHLVYRSRSIKPVFVFIYPTISMVLLLALYKEFGVFSILWLILVVSFTDTFAYFTGKSFGKTKFSPTSPNKTLEGVAGGIIAGTIIGSVSGLYFNGFLYALILSFFVSFFSVFGDLFESYLKRQAEVKDSGNIFPGHGGILDRLDGYLFGVVILFVGMKLI